MNAPHDFLVTISVGKTEPGRLTVALTLALAARTLGKKTALLLMVEGVHNASEGYVDSVDVGAPFAACEDLMESYIAAEGEIYACGACLDHNKVDRSKLMPEVKVVTGTQAVELLCGAKASLQFN
ncbi:MAG: DsrE family protein [Thermodesulfobacteriota bacterium]